MTSHQKGKVFRITGLPHFQPDENPNQKLENIIFGFLSEKEKESLSFKILEVVSDCYDKEDRKKIALVEFYGQTPAFLQALKENPLEECSEVLHNIHITFDCRFWGFTQLYTPTVDTGITAEYVACFVQIPDQFISLTVWNSVIAITGLDGHAYGSWRGKGKYGQMWLRDFLSKDMPQCRTMIYGYNSKLNSPGIDTILDFGRKFLEEIKKTRNSKKVSIKSCQILVRNV
jgi:hypothetical protein